MPIKRHTTLNDIWQVLAMASSDVVLLAELERLHPSRRVLFSAVEALRTRGKSTAVLERYATGQGWRMDRRANGGPPPPKRGDVRSYTVMKAPGPTGSGLVRIPVEHLGLRAGQRVQVAFDAGRIIVEAVPA